MKFLKYLPFLCAVSVICVACAGDNKVRSDGGMEADTSDAASDGETPDSGQLVDEGVDWGACPIATDHVADAAWTSTVTFAEPAYGCFDRGEVQATDGAVKNAFDRKVMLRLPAGTYRLPSADGTFPYRLPVCVATVNDGARVTDPATGEGTITRGVSGTRITQPLAADSAAAQMDEDPALFNSSYCPAGGDCTSFGASFGPDTQELSDCHVSIPTIEATYDISHRVERFTIAGGTVGFETITLTGLKDPGMIGLFPMKGPILRASGTYNGTDFNVTNYWDLAYVATHHVFERFYGVRFPSLIGDTCGLEVSADEGGFEGWKAYRLNCDYERIGELTITARVSEPL